MDSDFDSKFCKRQQPSNDKISQVSTGTASHSHSAHETALKRVKREKETKMNFMKKKNQKHEDKKVQK
jgi:hypothetical protein